jgi:hypothetical protein
MTNSSEPKKPARASKTTAASSKAPSSNAPSSKASSSKASSSKASSSKASKGLPILLDVDQLPVDETALSARWPEAVLVLSDDERKARVRAGLDTVLLDEVADDGRRRTRGFVKVVLRVPLHHPKARVYGVFVEVDRDGYRALQLAFKNKEATRVSARLATRLPFLDDAYGTRVVVEEDGSDQRARVVDADSDSLLDGPQIGPRTTLPRAAGPQRG